MQAIETCSQDYRGKQKLCWAGVYVLHSSKDSCFILPMSWELGVRPDWERVGFFYGSVNLKTTWCSGCSMASPHCFSRSTMRKRFKCNGRTWKWQGGGWKSEAENKSPVEKASVVVKVIHAHEMIKAHILHGGSRKALRVRPHSWGSTMCELQTHLKGESLGWGWDYPL